MHVVSLDFDDTLIESEKTKRRVLIEHVSKYENGLKALEGIKIDAREAGVKVTRYTIFRDWAVAMGRDEVWAREQADEYTKELEVALAHAAEVPGATALLRRLRAADVVTFINSATPQIPLEAAVKSRAWGKLVTGVLGSPEKGGDKFDNLHTISERSHSTDIIHVGDGDNDYSAATRYGCSFIGVKRHDDVHVEDMFGLISHFEDEGILPKCRICQKNAAPDQHMSFGGPLWSNQHFILCHASSPCPIAGWLVLHSQRHIASPAEFNDAEANDLGPILRMIQQALLKITKVPRVYSCAMAESSPHFHMHLVPRPATLNPADAGFHLFNLQAKAKFDPSTFAVPDAECLRVSSRLRESLSVMSADTSEEEDLKKTNQCF